MKKVAFKTLGCRLNQYETDALVTQFHQAGYRVVDYGEAADVLVVNTCTVTNQSDQKSRHSINHAARHHENALLVVTGCMANNHLEQLEANKQIAYVVDNERKSRIVSLIEAHFNGEIADPSLLSGNVFGFEAVDQSLHTRTSIKVQDGCDNFCSYCIVPSVRGAGLSRPPEEVLENIRRVIDNGFKEIVITGVNIGRYDYKGLDIEGLIGRVLELPGDFRLRISSLEPDGFGPDFHHIFAHPKMCPHLHLCIQSGSDAILKKMHRMYSVRDFLKVVESFRRHIPDFNFSTDVIVGFPGESEEDFRQTLEIVREVAFSHVHTFRYSRRKGTRADRMENQIPENIKAERSKMLRQLSGQLRLQYMKSMQSKIQQVMVERVEDNGLAKGYGEHYLPVEFTDPEAKRNSFSTVSIEGVAVSDPPCLLGHRL